MTRAATHHNRAVDSAFQLIDILATTDREHGLRLTDLVNRTGLPKTSVHRILWTLVTLDVVRHDRQRGTYQLGPKLATTAATARRPSAPAPRDAPAGAERRGQRDFSAPVLDRNGNPVARVTMTIRAFQLPEHTERKFDLLVRDTAVSLSRQLIA